MEQRVEMTSLVQVLEKLRQKGFDNEITMNDEKQMVCENLDKVYQPEDLLIFKNFRFEGDSDPDNNSVIYVVEDKDGDIGYLLDTYGAYSSHEGPEYDDFLKKIPVNERDDQELFT